MEIRDAVGLTTHTSRGEYDSFYNLHCLEYCQTTTATTAHFDHILPKDYESIAFLMYLLGESQSGVGFQTTSQFLSANVYDFLNRFRWD